MEVAVDALLVDGQEAELVGLGEEGFCVGESELEFAALMLVAEGEDVGLYRYGAVEPPVVLGYRVRELALDGRFGMEALDEIVAEGVVGFAVFGGQADLAGEAAGADCSGLSSGFSDPLISGRYGDLLRAVFL